MIALEIYVIVISFLISKYLYLLPSAATSTNFKSNHQHLNKFLPAFCFATVLHFSATSINKDRMGHIDDSISSGM